MAEIYALCCPETGYPRYIGKANNSQKRLATHLRAANRLDNPVHRWLRKLQRAGRAPSLVILEEATDWQTAERAAIAWYRQHEAPLLNVADGGDQPFCPREVCVEAARRLNIATARDPVASFARHAKRQLNSALQRGELSERVRAKMREAALRAPHLFGCWSSV